MTLVCLTPSAHPTTHAAPANEPELAHRQKVLQVLTVHVRSAFSRSHSRAGQAKAAALILAMIGLWATGLIPKALTALGFFDFHLQECARAGRTRKTGSP